MSHEYHNTMFYEIELQPQETYFRDESWNHKQPLFPISYLSTPSYDEDYEIVPEKHSPEMVEAIEKYLKKFRTWLIKHMEEYHIKNSNAYSWYVKEYKDMIKIGSKISVNTNPFVFEMNYIWNGGIDNRELIIELYCTNKKELHYAEKKIEDFLFFGCKMGYISLCLDNIGNDHLDDHGRPWISDTSRKKKINKKLSSQNLSSLPSSYSELDKLIA